MIKFRHQGSWNQTSKFLTRAKSISYRSILERYAQEGLTALSGATPKDTSLTSQSWGYEIVESQTGFKIYWTNTNVVDGVPVVILLQYGHGTRSGTYVNGEDFINPAIRPVFDRIAENLWKEVKSL